MITRCVSGRWLPAALLAGGLALLLPGPADRPALAAGGGQTRPQAGGDLLVFAASDLAFAIRELTAPFERTTGATVTLVLGSSGQLAQQIAHGAPADVFLSANEAFVDDLEARGLLLPGTRTRYAHGRLVVAYGEVYAAPPALDGLQDARIRRVAIANPRHAPYGQAAEEVLRRTGLWDAVRPRLIYADNIRQALQFVQSGAADASLLAASVADVPEIRWRLIDAALHEPLRQAGAVVRGTRQPDRARAFLLFVAGPEGQAVLRRFGFDPPD
jgi:molybdate transport system substrate-binding protein